MVNSFLKNICATIGVMLCLGVIPALMFSDSTSITVWMILTAFFLWVGFKKEHKKGRAEHESTRTAQREEYNDFEGYVKQGLGTASKTEKRLLFEMNRIGLNPKPQYKISRMHVDFAFPEDKVIVEVDGKEFHGSEKARKQDYERDRYLQTIGWKVMRITAEDVFDNPAKSAYKIKNFLKGNRVQLDAKGLYEEDF